MLKWICLDCNREQPDNELQCVCGNIDPCGFIEKDIYNAPEAEAMKKKDGIVEEPEPQTMEDKTPHEELKAETDEKPAKKQRSKKRKKFGFGNF